MAGIAGKHGASWIARVVRLVRTLLGMRGAGGRDETWLAGEDLAAAFLKSAGYRVLERNAVTPRGEADIVAKTPDDVTLVVVEVKARRVGRNARSDSMPPEASLTSEKRKRLRGIAALLATANGCATRVDLIAVEFREGVEPVVRHHVQVA